MNVRLCEPKVETRSCLENKAAIVMIQLCLTCGNMEKMVHTFFLKHFVYICVNVNSRNVASRFCFYFVLVLVLFRFCLFGFYLLGFYFPEF